MQNVGILAIGSPAGDLIAAGPQGQAAQQALTEQQKVNARTITFLLDHQDAITLKFIKDSGGTMDLVVRAPKDTELAKTDAVTKPRKIFMPETITCWRAGKWVSGEQILTAAPRNRPPDEFAHRRGPGPDHVGHPGGRGPL